MNKDPLKRWKFAIPILLAVWIVFIFCRSLQPVDKSSVESRWVLDLLNRLLPFGLTEHFVRKAAHFTEFAILGILSRALMGQRRQELWAGLLISLSIGLFIAVCDETIQLFVDGRGSQLSDVWLDFAGASAGAAVMTVISWFCDRRQS